MVAIASNVAEEVANGDEIGTVQVARERNLQISTVYRWLFKGLPAADGGRVRLEAVRRGKSWLTSRAAIRRFFAQLPTNGDATPTPRRTPTPGTRPADRREREQADARAQLAARGM